MEERIAEMEDEGLKMAISSLINEFPNELKKRSARDINPDRIDEAHN